MPPEVASSIEVDGNPLQSLLVLLAVLGAVAIVLTGLLARPGPVSSGDPGFRKRGASQDSLGTGASQERTSPDQDSSRKKPTHRPVVPSPKEERGSLRRGGNPIDILVCDPAAGDELMPATVINRSMGGVCLSATQPASKGTVLKVQVVNASEELPWVEVIVSSCRQTENRWELGCQFKEKLPLNVLLLFG